MKTTEPSWQFVLDNLSTIHAQARKFCPTGASLEDFHQDLILLVERRFPDYDPEKGTPKVFIWYLARDCRKREIGRWVRGVRAEAAMKRVRRSAHREEHRAAMQSEATVEFRRIVGQAQPHQFEAIQTLILGLSKNEVKEQIGVSCQARDGRIKRFARRFNVAA